jgi:oligopeptide/dipeptide ABC transporter ATP-binding protein
LFDEPKHPYAKALLSSVPDVSRKDERLYSIEGQPPSVFSPLEGCSFAPRCESATEKCHRMSPPRFEMEGRSVSCWLYEEKL